ncbi:hypothetical protein [Streptomyces sp. NPDC059639]|uniref:hypothetical protein n=1 Tax=Streptomyces sp. NPDC059639 TaxID=3346891 RepID=UPI0036B1D999
MTAEPPGVDDFQALAAALAGREMVVVAPHGTVNTGVVTGDQRQVVSSVTGCDQPAGASLLQGPVRAEHVARARRHFVPPPGFEDELCDLDARIIALVGDQGTGRETHALNLLAHGSEAPVLIQVDGTANLSRWRPRAHGVHGYLVTEPPDPFALRAWDVARLENLLAESGARLVIVFADAPGLTGTLRERLGIPIVRHRPPDPRRVFVAHVSQGCANDEPSEQWLEALGPELTAELLPEELPPRLAVRAAAVVQSLGGTGRAAGQEVLRKVAWSEGVELVARTWSDPVHFAHLLSLSAYGGLKSQVVTDRALDLLSLTEPKRKRDSGRRSRNAHGDTRRRPLSESWRILGAHCVRREEEKPEDTVSFFWPVSGAVWETLCRDHPDLLTVLHTWLASPGENDEEIERSGRAVAALAMETAGRSLALLADLATTPSVPAPQVAAWSLGWALKEPLAARKALDLLECWSVETQAPLRSTVAHACRSDRGQVTDEQAMQLLRRLIDSFSDESDGLSLVDTVIATLAQRFEAGDSGTRTTLLEEMRDWTASGGVHGALTCFAFPVLAGTDLAWWRDQLCVDAGLLPSIVALTGHALDEPASFGLMRDALTEWCSEGVGLESETRTPTALLDGLVAARQPGFLRWLLVVDRAPEGMPGKRLAARALTEWRRETPVPNAD